MSKKLPFMPLYVDDLLIDTDHLTNEQMGAYVRLLCATWKRDGTVPNDDQFLAHACHSSAQKWPHLKPVIMRFLTRLSDGRLTQLRLGKERARSLARSDLAAQAAHKRWNPKRNDFNGMRHANAYPSAMQRAPASYPDKNISSSSQPLPDDLPVADAPGADPTGPPPSIPVSDALLNTKLVKKTKGH